MEEKFTLNLIDPNNKHDKYYWARVTISNWLDAYSKLVEKHTSSTFDTIFANENRISDLTQFTKKSKENQENFCHEAVAQLLFSLNHVLGLKHVSENPHIHLLRMVSISWYYSIYHSARAMIILNNPNTPPKENHATTIRTWQDIFVYKKIILPKPYNIKITSLVKKDVEEQIKSLKNNVTLELNKQATTFDEYISHWH
jgi:uncharacterized protein (UPF0332 family)